MDSFLSFSAWKWPKSAKMSYFMQFWPILGPYDPLRSPVHYQRSTLKGSYFPKSLYKLVLPENGSISIYFEVKVLLKDSKVEVRGQNPQNSNLKKPIKSGKVLQTSRFLVKSCVLDWACWNFILNFHVYFYLLYFIFLGSKNGHFSVFYRNFACFLWGEGSKKFLSKKYLKHILKTFLITKNNILDIKNKF